MTLNLCLMLFLLTSSLMMREGLLPISSGGGIKDPRRDGTGDGAKDGRFSLTTSIFGVSIGPGA